MFSKYQARKQINSYQHEISPNKHLKSDSYKYKHKNKTKFQVKQPNSRNFIHVIIFIFLFSEIEFNSVFMLFGNPP